MTSARQIFLTIFMVGSLFSSLAYHMTRTLDDRSVMAEQKRLTQQTRDAMIKALDISQENLAGIERLFLASSHVDRNEFRIFVEAYLAKHPEIQSLEWIPRVPRSQREEFEALAQQDGYSGFRIRQRDAAGNMVPVTERQEYFPVYYLESLQGNESALGFDLGSNTERLATLSLARTTAQMQATASVTLVQDHGEQKGFLVFAPIFKSTQPDSMGKDKTLHGFALGVFRIDVLVNSMLQQGNGNLGRLGVSLVDHTTLDMPVQLYRSDHLKTGQVGDDGAWRSTSDISFAGRTWTLTTTATRGFLEQQRDSSPWIALLIGMLLTLMLASYLYSITNRSRRVNELVRSRTQQLEASRSRMRAILVNAVSAIITINDRGEITLFNPAAEKMFGHTVDEVMGENVKMLMPEPYHSHHDGYLSHHLKTGEKKIIGIGREVVGRRKDGSLFPMLLAVGEAHTHDVNSFVGIITDITESKEIEHNLIEAKRQAETANRHKSAFLNVMSHELRTPLTVILGYLPILKNRDKMPPPDSIVQIAGDMDITGQHLLELINDLLDISKIEAGEMNLHLEQVEVLPAIQEMEIRFKQMAQDKGIGLFTESEGFSLTVDQRRLRQILTNLVGNAMKFTHEGEIRITAWQEPGVVMFSVADTGIGIPQSDLPDIFDPFCQVDDSSTRKAGGSGLGLAITKRLVELHGGEIRVESEQGVGTRFSFGIKQQEIADG
jgi:PAS domain S-box-containing protein